MNPFVESTLAVITKDAERTLSDMERVYGMYTDDEQLISECTERLSKVLNGLASLKALLEKSADLPRSADG